MRSFSSTLAVMAMVALPVGCRSSSTGLSNPFLAPDRVPPPATRTLLPGTAQPYYPGDPVPNSPVINGAPTTGAPTAGYSQPVAPPAVTPQPAYQPPSTYAPQPAGALPPGGWNGAAQPIPNGYTSPNVLPTDALPINNQSINTQPALVVTPTPPVVPPLPLQVSPYPNQVASYQPQSQQQFVQPTVATGPPREVRIRAISSDNLDSNTGQPVSRDGFRPQGSSQVRKPTIASRLQLRKREIPDNRFGFDPQYGWLRGQLQQSSTTGAWELQYEPAEADAESFGGSLTLANPRVLGNLQPGDFVLLRGALTQAPSDSDFEAPLYQVSVVERQRI